MGAATAAGLRVSGSEACERATAAVADRLCTDTPFHVKHPDSQRESSSGGWTLELSQH